MKFVLIFSSLWYCSDEGFEKDPDRRSFEEQEEAMDFDYEIPYDDDDNYEDPTSMDNKLLSQMLAAVEGEDNKGMDFQVSDVWFLELVSGMEHHENYKSLFNILIFKLLYWHITCCVLTKN